MSPSRAALNGCVSFHSGCERSHRLHAIERESQLGVHWMFHPQGPVIIERRDAFGGWHEVRPALLRDAANESDDRLFVCAVVP